MVQNVGDNKFGVAKWIVDATLANATHTTITAAIASASAGDTIFIRPGTYTENFTMKAGVNLTAFNCDAQTPNVTIIGKITHNTVGLCSISGIRIQTNNDYLLVVSGNVASPINFYNCYFNVTNHDAISHTSSDAGAQIQLYYCWATLGNFAFVTSSSAASVAIEHSLIAGNSATASTWSSSFLSAKWCYLGFPMSTSGTGSVSLQHCVVEPATNTTSITSAGANSSAFHCVFFSGNAIAIVATSYIALFNCNTNSSNAAAISGAGTLAYADLSMAGSSEITTTTQSASITRPGVTRSLHQPAFSAYLTAGASNVTGDGTAYAMNALAFTEIYDRGNNFDAASGTFTAPYDGLYLFRYTILAADLEAAHTDGYTRLNTTSRAYFANTLNYGAIRNSGNYVRVQDSCMAYMAAGNTAFLYLMVSGGNKIVDIGQDYTEFQGYMLC